ncbi:MAG: hypothetical protein ACP5N3_03855 [Candidatus Nanoarchaeia archaeon]
MGPLLFLYTQGEETPQLIIDRTAPVDLYPFFKELFECVDKSHYHQHHKRYEYRSVKSKEKRIDELDFLKELETKRWSVDEQTAIAKFEFDDFLRAIVSSFKVKTFYKFLEEQMTDKNDFFNEILLNKLDKFEENYSLVNFYWNESHFIIDSKEIPANKIESLIPYAPKRREIYFRRYFSKKDYPNITQMYHARHGILCEQELYENSKKDPEMKTILKIPSHHLWLHGELNLYSIISKYKLPTDDITIIKKSELETLRNSSPSAQIDVKSA